MTDKKVTVYTTTVCPYCIQVKQYLKSKGVSFEEVNVGENRQKAMEMVQKSGQNAVPQIEINGQMVVGFNKSKLDQLLGF